MPKNPANQANNMKTEEPQITPFFLSMLKHEIANGVNNLFQVGMSLIDHPSLDESARDDLKYDHLDALDNSQLALNKLHTLLYTNLINDSEKSSLKPIFEKAINALPLNPSSIVLDDTAPTEQMYPIELMTQLLIGVFQLIIRNDQDGFDNGVKISVSNSNDGCIKISYSGTSKSALFSDLSSAISRFDKKSKKALEYEFLRHLVACEAFTLTADESSITIRLTI